jgi:hypothetical protein
MTGNAELEAEACTAQDCSKEALENLRFYCVHAATDAPDSKLAY